MKVVSQLGFDPVIICSQADHRNLSIRMYFILRLWFYTT